MLVTSPKLMDIDVGEKVKTFCGRGTVVGYVVPDGLSKYQIEKLPMYKISYAVRIKKFRLLDGEHRAPHADGEYLKFNRFDVNLCANTWTRTSMRIKVMTQYGLGKIVGYERLYNRVAVRLIDKTVASPTLIDLQNFEGALYFHRDELRGVVS